MELQEQKLLDIEKKVERELCKKLAPKCKKNSECHDCTIFLARRDELLKNDNVEQKVIVTVEEIYHFNCAHCDMQCAVIHRSELFCEYCENYSIEDKTPEQAEKDIRKSLQLDEKK